MLIDSKLPKYLWAAAMSHAAWIKNRSPTRALNGKTPFEARYGEVPDLSKAVPFGTRAWVKIADTGKLNTHACFGYFVGFNMTSIGYNIYFPDKKQVRVEREVKFNRDDEPDSVIWTDGTLPDGESIKSSQRPRPTHADNSDNPPGADEPNCPTPTEPGHPQDPELEDLTPEDDGERLLANGQLAAPRPALARLKAELLYEAAVAVAQGFECGSCRNHRLTFPRPSQSR